MQNFFYTDFPASGEIKQNTGKLLFCGFLPSTICVFHAGYKILLVIDTYIGI